VGSGKDGSFHLGGGAGKKKSEGNGTKESLGRHHHARFRPLNGTQNYPRETGFLCMRTLKDERRSVTAIKKKLGEKSREEKVPTRRSTKR